MSGERCRGGGGRALGWSRSRRCRFSAGGAPQGVDPEAFSWFQAVDADRSGYISVKELKQALLNSNWSAFNDETCLLMISEWGPLPSPQHRSIGRTEGGRWSQGQSWAPQERLCFLLTALYVLFCLPPRHV